MDKKKLIYPELADNDIVKYTATKFNYSDNFYFEHIVIYYNNFMEEEYSFAKGKHTGGTREFISSHKKRLIAITEIGPLNKDQIITGKKMLLVSYYH